MTLKKIDNHILEQMLKDGKSQREIARFFDCSDAAVSKILKRWQVAEPPASFKKLTEKQQKFVVAKLKGKSNTSSAMESYDCGSLGSARQLGQRLNNDPDIQTAYHALLYQVGIGKRRRAERLRDIVEAKDLTVSARGIELAAKLCGELRSDNIDITVNNYDPRAITAGIQELRQMLEDAKEEEAKTIDITEEI
jgi:predicted transcriptional regulator